MEAAVAAGGGNRLWQFGGAELDERTLELRVRGEPTALEPKPLEVLFHLLHHAGEVVTKDELAEACWPRRVLSESVLTKTISRLREVLQDDDQSIIRTVHGYGYRLVAAVNVVAAHSAPPAAPRLGFKAGDHPPLRPLWSLVERLGSGRSGEAWLARHDKTREQRVYKFPLDVAALTSLKREITLSRLLGEAGSSRVARILDWNLEQEPYFIESEYASGGNLMQWAEREGGLDRILLPDRIELAAQIAETLASAHAVGVLHKDLKPANVLVDLNSGRPQIKLADFGSGGVLDPERLDALGITRLGFTRTLAAGEASSGTPLYLAPEVLAGQPATVQADIYALGVMLYQLVVGDFRKPLAPGWELDIDDEVLREDIAEAAAGNRQRRLADASALAQRLHTLDDRRMERARQRQEQAQAEEARRVLERMRLRRRWMLATMAALVCGTTLSLGLFLDARRARDEAARAAAASRAVAEFLSTDLFANISAEQRPPREWTVEQLLNAASGQIDKRFAGQPDVAQRIHASMGGAYFTLEDGVAARRHFQSAHALALREQGPGSQAALQAAEKLLLLDYADGRLRERLPEYERALAAGEQALGTQHAEVQVMRRYLSWAYQLSGDWQKAHDSARLIFEAAHAAEPQQPAALAAAARNLGNVLNDLGRYAEAERQLRAALAFQDMAADGSELARANIRMNLVQPLTALGRYAEAQAELSAVQAVYQRWAPNDSATMITWVVPLLQGTLLLEQGEVRKALDILGGLGASSGAARQAADVLQMEALALALQRAQRLDEALTQMQQALSQSESDNGSEHPWSLRIRIGLADVLREMGRVDEAWTVLNAANPQAAAKLPAGHPILGERRRVEGLLQLAQGRGNDARLALVEAQQVSRSGFGADHWRTRRISEALARLPAS